MEAAPPETTGKDRQGHPFPWLNLLVTEPYYLLHFLAFFSYFVVRSSASQSLSPDLAHRLFRREIQAILAFLVLVAVKIVKDETWEEFIADILLYSKGFLFAVTLIIDYHLALCYLLGFLVIFIVTKQPPYNGLGDCSQLTPLLLESLLTEESTSRFWLVEFRTSYASRCVRKSRIFPDLSTIYSNKNISFGIVNLGHFPNAAEKFGIPLQGICLIMCYMKNQLRLPDYQNSIMNQKFLDQMLARNFFANILSLIDC